MDQPSFESAKRGEEVVRRLDSIEKLILNLNDKVSNSNTKCINASRLNNLETLIMKLKSKIDVLKDNFGGSFHDRKKECPFTGKLLNIKSNVSEDIHERTLFDVKENDDTKGCDKEISEPHEKTLKSPSNSLFLEVYDEVYSYRKKKTDLKIDNSLSKNTKLGIPLRLKNIAFGEPTLPRGLKTLRDSPIDDKIEHLTKKKQKLSPSHKEMPKVKSGSKGPLAEKDILPSNNGSLSKGVVLVDYDRYPTPLYEKYLHYIGDKEAEICKKIYKYDKLGNTVYCNKGTGLFWTASDVKCLFPDLQVNDFLIDLVAFEMNLEASKKGTNKLYLPSFFLYLLLGYDAYNNESVPGGTAAYMKTLEDYIPKDTRHIEQVFFPVLENMGGHMTMLGMHWFLLVIGLTERKCYLLDSLNTTIERKNLALKLIMDLYVHNLCLGACDIKIKKMYLPLLFQGVVTKVNPMIGEMMREKDIETLKQVVAKYLHEDVIYAEQVYIPMFEMKNSHWFLLVIDIMRKKCFLLDSLHTTTDRINLALNVLTNASIIYGNDPRLSGVFKDVTRFSLHIPETNKQHHEIESAIYVIKYMEASSDIEWNTLYYTEDDVRVERLRTVVKWVNSKYNVAKHFGTSLEKVIWIKV